MSYYAGGAAGTLVAGLAFEAWGWGGSVFSIALMQGLAGSISVLVWRPSAQGAG